jgi:hypothetical protein
MHIAAAMAALRVEDLDPTAKHALLVVCCRANQHTGLATVSTARAAADMQVARNTAAAALGRLVETGYLPWISAWGKLRGGRSTCSIWEWHLLNSLTRHLLNSDATEDSMDTREGERTGVAPAGKPAERFETDLPPNPWVFDDEAGTAHRLTVDDILNTPRLDL